jgi:hypothetical protein
MFMKGIEFDVVLEKTPDGWFIADVPAMLGCHSQGKTKKEALANIKPLARGSPKLLPLVATSYKPDVRCNFRGVLLNYSGTNRNG